MNWREKLNSTLFNNIDVNGEFSLPVKPELGNELEALISDLLKEALTEAIGEKAICEDCGVECHCCGEASGINAQREHVKKVLAKYN